MTDHTADANKKVEPCAWCHSEPTEHLGDYDCTCVLGVMCDKPGRDGWNETQRRILEQRRKDFEAGHYCASTGDFMPEENDFDDYLARERK